jgi:hypothetical protein
MGYNSTVLGFEKRLSGKISIQKTNREVASRSYHASWCILNSNDDHLSLNGKQRPALFRYYILPYSGILHFSFPYRWAFFRLL